MQFFYFCFAAGRIYGFYRLYKKDTMARRQAWMLIHVGALIGKVIVNTFHFFKCWQMVKHFPVDFTIAMIAADTVLIYHCIVVKQIATNYSVETMRTQAFAAS